MLAQGWPEPSLGKESTFHFFLSLSFTQILTGRYQVPHSQTEQMLSLLFGALGSPLGPDPCAGCQGLGPQGPRARAGGGGEIGSDLSPAASFYKTSNPPGPESQAHVLPIMPHPNHHPPPPATSGKEEIAGKGGWAVETVAQSENGLRRCRGRGLIVAQGWPRKELPQAPTYVQRRSERLGGGALGLWGAELAGREEGRGAGAPGAPSGSSAPPAELLPSLHAPPPLRVRTRTRLAGTPREPRRQLPAPPHRPAVSAFLPGRREVGIGSFFVMEIEALPEVPSPKAR